jgi:hypothetical protein
MKKKLILIAVLLVLFVLFIVIRFYFFDKRNSLGRLKVVSSPTAQVFINNVSSGKTPFENADLEVGEYTVRLVPEGNDKNTVKWEGKVSVYRNTLTYVSRELGTSEVTSAGEVLTVVKMLTNPKGNTGEVAIETEPTGAIVFLDNDEKGVAPLVLQDIPAGDHELSVFLPGFFRRSQKIKVEKGYQVKAIFKLALDQSHKTLEEELDAKRKEASEEAKKKAEEEKKKSDEEEKDTTASGTTLEVLDNELGYLNVRSEPSTTGDIIAKVNPGETYEYTDEQNSWYKITLDDGEEGWVSADYVEVVQ